MTDKVALVKGGLAVDDRGQLSFCNDFDMKDIRRFYIVSNHESRFIRAWHAHKQEKKIAIVTKGVAVIAAVKIDNWDSPDKAAKIHRFLLSDKNPGVIVIPQGYANGFMTLVEGTQVMFFSTSTIEESKGDDYRYDAYYWNPWDIVPR